MGFSSGKSFLFTLFRDNFPEAKLSSLSERKRRNFSLFWLVDWIRIVLKTCLGHAMDLLQRCPEKVKMYMWETPLQGSCIPYKVWWDHKSLTEITSYMWGTPLQGSHIPYKVWWAHKSLTVTRFLVWWDYQSLTVTRFLHSISGIGDHKSHWQLQGSHIPYKVWGTISHWQLQGSCISYKVWGNRKSHWQWQGSRSCMSLPPRTGGFN